MHTEEIFRNPERHQFLCQAKQQKNYAVKCARSVRRYILMAVVTVYDLQSVFCMYFQSVIVLRLAIVAHELRTVTLIYQLMF